MGPHAGIDPSMSNHCGQQRSTTSRFEDDRIGIVSPGGALGTVSAENFGTGVTDYRNPNLAEALRVAGFVQHFGAGIPTAERELQRNGNPPPEFRVDGTSMRVTVRVVS